MEEELDVKLFVISAPATKILKAKSCLYIVSFALNDVAQHGATGIPFETGTRTASISNLRFLRNEHAVYFLP